MSLDRGPGRPSSPLRLSGVVLSGNRRGRGGHRRGSGVRQRGVAAFPARGVAALRVGRHGAELAVEIGQDPRHRHHVGPLESQRLSHLPVLARPFGLPGDQGLWTGLDGSRGHRGGSVQDRTARYRH